jgi:hypothetical protein
MIELDYPAGKDAYNLLESQHKLGSSKSLNVYLGRTFVNMRAKNSGYSLLRI